MKWLRWIGPTVAVLAAVLMLFAGPVEAQSFGQGDPTEPANDTRTSEVPVFTGGMADVFVVNGETSLSRSYESFHGFNVTDARTDLVVSADAVLAGGSENRTAFLNVTVEQDGDRVASCEWPFSTAASAGNTSQHAHMRCGENGTAGLSQGNYTVRFSLSTQDTNPVVLDESFISVALVQEEEVQPVVHDFLQQATIGAVTLGDVLWITIWFALFVWTIRMEWWFAAFLSWTASLSAFLPEVLSGPENAAWPVFVFALAVLLHIAGDWRRAHREDTKDESVV